MSKKILIDLQKFRDTKDGTYNYGECVYDFHPGNYGMKLLVEQAMMMIACRKCEDAPCIAVCPEEAMEKDENGVVHRASNLCVACQSCVAVCPFGTIMNEIFTAKKSICDYCDLNENTTSLRCMETAPAGAITLVDFEEDESQHIYKLNDKVLVKEMNWEKIMNNE
ncbi:MAG: 4Fe-4S binding protein [Candidatus Cloacimonetes bacterium]|nr:4Fe-4S binding protein [Candidatus Cloacimonadota bacterium]